MTAISLCLAIHEPYCLRRYTVFDVGESSIYEDDDRSCHQAMYYARNCYLPACEILLKQINLLKGDFRFSLSVSDAALDLFEQYTPEVIDNLKAMAKTGAVEFIGEAGSHSLAYLYAREEFMHQVQEHSERLETLFGKAPKTFRNPELLFNNDLANAMEQLGFTAILTEGAPEVLGWRSPNFVYTSSVAKSVALLLRNPELSSNISQKFSNTAWSEWPLTAEKFAQWCKGISENGDIINLYLDFHAFGLRNKKESGIFEFLEALPKAILDIKKLKFLTPKQIVKQYESKDSLTIPHYISWNDEGCDLRGWLGNEMQKDALKAVYQLAKRVRALGDVDILRTYSRLQTADYFHYMSTRWFSQSQPDRPNPYQSPYDAYISYMNMLKDFTERLSVEEEHSEKRHHIKTAVTETTPITKTQVSSH